MVIPLFIFIILFYFNSKIIIDNFENKKNSLNNKISVLILSYNRPHNLEKSLPILSKYKIIDEIVVAHGSPNYYKDFKYDKVKNIKDYKNNDIYGCARRWFLVDKLKNEIVLILDDDLLPDETLVNKLYDKLINHNRNTHYGSIKRLCNGEGYISKDIDNYNIILTGMMLTKKKIIKTYMEKQFKYYEEWIIKHKGNCEDLAFNLFINKYFKEKPVFVEGNYENLDPSNGYQSISDHYKIRNEFCKKFS